MSTRAQPLGVAMLLENKTCFAKCISVEEERSNMALYHAHLCGSEANLQLLVSGDLNGSEHDVPETMG